MRDSKRKSIDKNIDKYRENAREYARNHKSENLKRMRQWRSDNSERDKTNGKNYREANKDAIQQRIKTWWINNPEKRKARNKRWLLNNKDASLAKNARRRAQKMNATAIWADHSKIKLFYMNASKLTNYTGIEYHVDHIIPLSNNLVCGLHVEYNLQILTASDNHKKGNKFTPFIINFTETGC